MLNPFRIVVWGIGTNGKNLIDMIGVENVIAIIDQSKHKQDAKNYKGIPITDFEEYKNRYMGTYIVVTPMKYKEIEKELIVNKIDKYFIQGRSEIRNIVLSSVVKGSFIDRMGLNAKKYFRLLGVNLFSIYLYQDLYKREVAVDIIADNDRDNMLLKHLQNEGYVGLPVENKKWKNIEKCNVLTEGVWNKTPQDNNIDLDVAQMNEIFYKPWSEQISTLKGCLKDKRIFIIATGPSLRKEDLEKLHIENEVTMSMNGIIYLLEQVKWKPQFYVASDGIMIREYEANMDIVEALSETKKIFSDNYLEFWEREHDEKYYCFHQQQQPYNIEFSEECEKQVFSGSTVVYACLQLAVYMGVSEIYLLGCDFSFSNNMDDAQNHCYNKPTKGYVFDFDNVKRAYEKAKEYAEAHGVVIKNATRGGKLEVFERVDFDSLF